MSQAYCMCQRLTSSARRNHNLSQCVVNSPYLSLPLRSPVAALPRACRKHVTPYATPWSHIVCRNTDLPQCVEHIHYYAGWADKIHGKVIPVNGEMMAYTYKEPIGVVGQIIPW